MILSPTSASRRVPAWPLPLPRVRFLNAANLLTLSRLLLAGLVWLAPTEPWFVLLILTTAGLTDILDGWVARRHGLVNTTGDWLDPLCDKTFAISVLAAVGFALRPPIVLLALIAAREIVLLPMLALWRLLAPGRRFAFRAAAIGKAATVAQFAGLMGLLFNLGVKKELSWLAGLLGVAAAVHYIARARRAGTSPTSTR